MDSASDYPKILLRLLCSKVTGFSGDALSKSFQKSMVTFSSNITSTYPSDEFALVQKIKKTLVKQTGEKDAVEFTNLYRKLQACDDIKNRWSILHFLLSLTETTNTKNYLKFTGASGDFIASTPHPAISLIPDSHQTLSTIHPSQQLQLFTSSLSGRNATINQKNQHPANKTDPTNASFLPNRVERINKNADKYFTEYDEEGLLSDVLYAVQSIEGRTIKYTSLHKSFRIHNDAIIPGPIKRLAHRVCEGGFLHAKVRDFVVSKSSDQSYGLVGQSFCSSLQQELIEYYKIIAILEAQLKQDRYKETEGLTLRRIEASMQTHLCKLKTLAALVDVCNGKKGGELASVVYLFSQHGDPVVQKVTNDLLNRVCQPIFQMISDWIYKGQLENSHHEFLVSEDPSMTDDKLWTDKFSLRKSQLPSFITQQQANKILLTGKSIHFLRTMCSDHTVMMDKPQVKVAHTDQVDTIFRQDYNSKFNQMVDVTYKHTSSYLLHVLYNTYKLMSHIKAMRKYILLGQGDFIRHLMDLLEEDLGKPAQSLQRHNLTGVLEMAIRATNAQYEDMQIISRLDVILLQVSPGDSGWDVFSLQYHVTGHIGTVFNSECMMLYRRVFNFLWRAKRMEYILSSLWELNITYSKSLRSYIEFRPLMHAFHLLGNEMMHLVQQIQYYINFEVLECSWVELMAELNDACDLDQVIQAHNKFINTVFSHSLLDSLSTPILTQLRSLFDMILQFQDLQKDLYAQIDKEVALRNEKNHIDEEECLRRASFVEAFLPSSMSKVRVLSQSYKRMVEQFLSLVSTFSEVSLRCLIFRLNFSEYYVYHNPHTGRKSKMFIPPSYQNLKSHSRIKDAI